LQKEPTVLFARQGEKMSNLTTTQIENKKIAEQLNALYRDFQQTLFGAKQKAILLGEKLIAAKGLIGHGGFSKWVDDNCEFSFKTADIYIKCAENKQLIASAPDLAEARRLIETAEAKKKREEDERKEKLRQQYKKTRQKGAGWGREMDYYNRQKEAEERAQQDMKARMERMDERSKQQETPHVTDEEVEELKKMLGNSIGSVLYPDLKLANMDEEKRQRTIFNMVEQYVATFSDVNHKLEALSKLTTYCRRKMNELQPQTVAK
jgi:Protein of unknown function (DUF3102)